MELQTTNKIALREPMKLTSENVEAIFKDCLAESDYTYHIRTNRLNSLRKSTR